VKLKSQKKRGEDRRTGKRGREIDYRGVYNERPFEENTWK